MRLIFLGNARVGCEVVGILRQGGDEIVGAVLHPLEKRREGARLLETLALPAERCFLPEDLENPARLQLVRALEAEAAVSVYFGYILRQPFLDSFPRGVINLHPSFLPWNRGAWPNVWTIVDATPAGATLHYVDEGIDTGDIIAQARVKVEATDTGETLYNRLEQACIGLFSDTWPLFRAGRAGRRPQPRLEGSVHRLREAEAIDEIDLDLPCTARRLINILRARTHPPHPGAFFRDGGKKIHLRLQLEREGDE